MSLIIPTRGECRHLPDGRGVVELQRRRIRLTFTNPSMVNDDLLIELERFRFSTTTKGDTK